MAAGRIVIACGGRALGERVLEDLARDVAAAHAEPRLLARPVLLVTASNQQRAHWATRIAEHLGPAVLGLRVATLWAIARELDAGADASVARADGDLTLRALARAAVREEPALRALQERFDHGLELAVPSLCDLRDAGLRSEQVERAARLVRGDLAGAVLRAAARTLPAEAERDATRSGILRRAALQLAAQPATLGARALRIVGFGDATGVAIELLRALLERGAWLYLDEPPDPERPQGRDRSFPFVRRFAALLDAPLETDARRSPAAREPATFDAAGADAESREVAHRVRALLDAGAVAERIGIVARTLEPYAAPLREHLDALGIPFSGGAAPRGWFPEQHRLNALLALLRDGGDAPIDVWVARVLGSAPELVVALRAHGVGTVQELVNLAGTTALERGSAELSLPRAHGAEERDDEPAPAKIARARLREAGTRARAWLAELADWRATPRTIAEHAARLARLGADPVWRPELDALAERCALSQRLPFADFLALADEGLAALGGGPLGGAGAGVRVLDATHARGIAFEHLFLVGLNRHVFPAAPREDPLLPDFERDALRALLPALHLARERDEEERHRFAALLAASAAVTLSWQRASDNGAALERSAFADPWVGPAHFRVPRAEAERLAHDVAGSRPLPAREALRLIALRGARAHWRDALALVVPPAEAQARAEVLDAFDPDRRTAEGKAAFARIDAFGGGIGRRTGAGDLRRDELYVTTLESYARCPWQSWLTRFLRLEPGRDPLIELPGLTPLLIGNAVHQALESLLRPGSQRSNQIAEAFAAPPLPTPRPGDPAIERASRDAARAAALAEGIHLEGLHEALARVVQARVTLALARDWREPGAVVQVLGVELRGTTRVRRGSAQAVLRFRADRADLVDRRLRLTDYKTRRGFKRFEQTLATGELLQGAAYARCDEAGTRDASGRYLFAHPEAGDSRGVVELPRSDPFVAEAFPEVAAKLWDGIDAGHFFPRVEDPEGEEPDACRWCAVAAACLRGDSTWRKRLREIAPTGNALRAALWRRTLAPPPPGGERR